MEFLNEQILDKGMAFQGRAVGGLSALTFDQKTGEFLALSDAKSRHRFYRLQLHCQAVGTEKTPAKTKRPAGKKNLFSFLLQRSPPGEKQPVSAPFDYAPCAAQKPSPPFRFIFREQELLRENGLKQMRRNMDPEGMGLKKGEGLFISSEGQQIFLPPSPPQIFVFSEKGVLKKAWPVPSVFWNEKRLSSFGARENKGFESLALTERHLWTATEKPLKQDSLLGAATTAGHKARRKGKLRFLRSTGAGANSPLFLRLSGFDLKTGTFLHQYPYFLEPGAGLSEMIAVTDDIFLTLERAYNKQTGNTRVHLFTADCRKASDIAAFFKGETAGALSKTQGRKTGKSGALPQETAPSRPGGSEGPLSIPESPLSAAAPSSAPEKNSTHPVPCGKKLVFDFKDLPGGKTVDNLEGMALGPELPKGGRLLVFVSDNNFSSSQKSQFLFFRLMFPHESFISP